jgi:hypothetical protein
LETCKQELKAQLAAVDDTVMNSATMVNASAALIDQSAIIATHTIMLAIGWLVLVPAGIWMSTVGRKRFTNWHYYHAMIMIAATATILSAAVMAHSITDPRFVGIHQLTGMILDGLILIQALAGLWIFFVPHQEDNSRPALQKLHRIVGLVVYLGGLAYGFYGMHLYISGLPHDSCFYRSAIGFGVTLTLHAALLSHILPAWWQNCGEQEYIQVPVPELPS